jgi:RNA-binding protein
MNPQSPTLRELKARAQKLKPVIHVGHDGVTEKLISALDQALDDHGLVKIRFTDHKAERKALTTQILEQCNARPVLLVGHTATIFRAAKNQPVGDEESSRTS